MITDHKITVWTQPVSAEADRPQRSAAEMKAVFDSNANQLKAAFNALIDELSSALGAQSVGASLEGVAGDTVAELLEALFSAIGQRPTRSEVLTLDNTAAYTPTAATHPATKAYVDAYAVEGGKAVSVNGKTGASIVLTPADLGAARASRTLRCTLAASGWSAAAPYTQTVSLSGLTTDDLSHLFATAELNASGETGLLQQSAWNAVSRIDAAAGTLTATCWEEKPSIDLPLRLELLG